MKAKTYLIINRYQRSRTVDRRPYVTLACECGGTDKKYTKPVVDDKEEEMPIKRRGPYRTKKCGCPFKLKREQMQQVTIGNCSCTTGGITIKWLFTIPVMLRLQDLRRSSCNRLSSSGKIMYCLVISYDFSDNKTLFVQLEEPDAGKKHGRGSSLPKCTKGLYSLLQKLYNLPLLEAVRMTPTGKKFTVAIASLCNEQNTTYRWVLQQIKHLYVTSAMLNGHGSILNEGFGHLKCCILGLRQRNYGYQCVMEKFVTKSNAILKNISNKISHLALKKIWLEIKKARGMVEDPRKIGADIPDVHERDIDSEMRNLTLKIEEISTSPISKVREVRRLIKGVIRPVLPEDPCPPLTNPPEIAITKGRRKTNSMKRDKSH
ncbi:hypothetical protein M9H77_15776 [Catharanthus roseus]|uniref:Uncharacterized protein n=1 Tax=Catharanthus roseus TaxID=4058 RepID=A0ACC0AY40_CATRO|nr:hypothetical protein M9H77_15776 [Catharanthus roseus]